MANEKDQKNLNGIQIPEVYTNTAVTNFSPYEFELTMGLASANYEGVRPVVNIRMSPQFAKDLAKILSDNVAVYEANIAQIVVPEKGKGKK